MNGLINPMAEGREGGELLSLINEYLFNRGKIFEDNTEKAIN